MVAETEEEGLGTGKKRIGVFIFGCRMELVGTCGQNFSSFTEGALKMYRPKPESTSIHVGRHFICSI